MTERPSMDNVPAPQLVDEAAEAKINEMYSQEIDQIRKKNAGDVDCESGL